MGSWQPFLAAGTGAIQAVPYFAFRGVTAPGLSALWSVVTGKQFEIFAGRLLSAKYFCQKFCCEKVNLEFSEEKKFSPGGTLIQRLFHAGFLHLIVFLSMKVDFIYLVQFRAADRNCHSAFLICRL